MSKQKYKWGILGPGKIAHKFAAALSVTEKGELHAVGSRDAERAKAFGLQYGASKTFGSYQELVEDDETDIIYIATPHHLHYEMTKLCFEHGKHVLCEKPVCMNLRQFSELRQMASEKKLFYMDALWTRFLPGIRHLTEIIHEIGDIQSLVADFGFKAPYDEKSRIFNPELGGGTILDIGIYTLFMPLLVLGYPSVIRAEGITGTTGVDISSAIILKYPGGAMASLSSTFMAHTATRTEISGTKGRISILPRFFAPTGIELTLENGKKEVYNFEIKKNGYEYEAEECMQCLDEGLIQSPALPHSFTADLMRLMDEVRRQIGVQYPCDLNR